MVLLPRLTKQIMRRCSSGLLGLDLRLLMALSYVGDHDGAPQQELADTLCMDGKNVVLLLNELEDSGHLVRRRDAVDRRRHRVYITSVGREALERAGRAMQEIEDDVLQALDADERRPSGRWSPVPSVTPSPPRRARRTPASDRWPPGQGAWASRPVRRCELRFGSGGRAREVAMDELHDHRALADGRGAALDRP